MSRNGSSREIAARRLLSPPQHVTPAFAKLEGRALLARFVAELCGRSAEVIEIESLDGLPRAIEPRLLAAGLSISDLVVSDDPAFQGLFPSGEVRPPRVAKAALTHAWGGVGETGTLVLASGPDNPTSLAFQPDVHVVAVSRLRIYAAYEEALSDLVRERGGLPRAVNLVSGPSRTGDIGGRIVLGAHGPRRLIVVIYG